MSEPFDYAQAKADADELIAEFGQAAVLTRPTWTGPAHNPTPGEPDEYEVTIAVLDFTDREIDGDRVKSTDKKVLLAKGELAIDPQTSDKLLVNNKLHSLIAPVRTIAPAGIVVFYELQARA